MTELKQVVVNPPLSLRDDKKMFAEVLCKVHGIEVEFTTLGDAFPILTLTEDSNRLALFAERFITYLNGPRSHRQRIYLDLLTLDDPVLSHVLVIEDDPGMQKVYRRMLRGLCNLTIASNAEDAVRYLESVKFDKIFCDFELIGGPSGKHVYEWMRDNQPDSLPNFWFVSGSTEPESIHYNYINKNSGKFDNIDELIFYK